MKYKKQRRIWLVKVHSNSDKKSTVFGLPQFINKKFYDINHLSSRFSIHPQTYRGFTKSKFICRLTEVFGKLQISFCFWLNSQCFTLKVFYFWFSNMWMYKIHIKDLFPSHFSLKYWTKVYIYTYITYILLILHTFWVIDKSKGGFVYIHAISYGVVHLFRET